MYGVESVKELKQEIKKFIVYYNSKRLHSALKYQTPMSVYEKCLAANDEHNFMLFCDIETYRKKQEKERLKYAA